MGVSESLLKLSNQIKTCVFSLIAVLGADHTEKPPIYDVSLQLTFQSDPTETLQEVAPPISSIS